MVIVRGQYEVTQIAAACIISVGLFISGFNVLALPHRPDLPASLFILAVVMLLNHVRVIAMPPVDRLWCFLLELAVCYLCTQIMVVCVWQNFQTLVYTIRVFIMNTQTALNLLARFPNLTMLLYHWSCFWLLFVVALSIAGLSAFATQSLDYCDPSRRRYEY
ncbi:hypothetical protein KR018_001643, partial [Drosophila ironensis]